MASTETDIISYNISNQIGNAIINNSERTILVTMPYNTALNMLTANFQLSQGAKATVNDVLQTSGVTINNFTTPLIYKVTAQDNITTNEWTITVQNKDAVLVNTINITSSTGNDFIDVMSGTLQLNAEVLPIDADNKNITWSVKTGSEFAEINQNGLVTAIGNGTATIWATANDGSSTFDEFTIVITNQEDEIKSVENKITIYPNPANDHFVVKLANTYNLVIYDIAGKPILSQLNVSNNQLIDIQSLSKGTYILEFTNKNDRQYSKLIIK